MIKRGRLLTEGKTKKVFLTDDNGLCIFEMKDDVTMHDDPDQTIIVPGKGGWANTATCCMFDVLAKGDIPVAYRYMLSDTEMVAVECSMISLECIARRVARGSICKRRGIEDGSQRFQPLLIEFHVKTSHGGVLRLWDGETVTLPMPMVMKKNQQRLLDDPLIANPRDVNVWRLLHPHLLLSDSLSQLEATVEPDRILPPGVTIECLEDRTRSAFLELEQAWRVVDGEMHDIKFEFGIGTDKVLYLADVVEGDSWRMKHHAEELSKQPAREGAGVEVMAAKYRCIADLSQQVRDAVCCS